MDNRQYKRFDSGNLLSYVCVNGDDKVVQQGMGKTLDVSEGGILLETHVTIEDGYEILLSIGLGDEMADIRGKVVYSRLREDGKVDSGIQFLNVTAGGAGVLMAFIKKFHSK